MAIKKIRMRPEGTNDYGDVLHPETSADMVQGQVLYGTTAGTNAYSLATTSVPSLYAGLRVTLKIGTANTGASTLNVSGLGAKPIVKAGGTALSSGNLKAGGVYTLVYDGVNFTLQGEGASGNATASDLLSGKTATTDAGNIVGTMPNRGAVVITPSTSNQTISLGYHNGSGIVNGDANLVASNIVNGKSIFGVSGTLVEPQVVEGTFKLGSYNRKGTVTTGAGFIPNVIIVYRMSDGAIGAYVSSPYVSWNKSVGAVGEGKTQANAFTSITSNSFYFTWTSGSSDSYDYTYGYIAMKI